VIHTDGTSCGFPKPARKYGEKKEAKQAIAKPASKLAAE
jgi:hypothetical protein